MSYLLSRSSLHEKFANTSLHASMNIFCCLTAIVCFSMFVHPKETFAEEDTPSRSGGVQSITLHGLPESELSYPVAYSLSKLAPLPDNVGVLTEEDGKTVIPAQSDGEHLWWMVSPQAGGTAVFHVVDAEAPRPERMDLEKTDGSYTFLEDSMPIMQYRYRTVPMPEGLQMHHFPDGRKFGGPRSNYLHPVFGLHGELLTDDYPADHPHHRGVWWSWPVTRFGDRVADIWAVSDVRAYPEAIKEKKTGPVFARLTAVNLWKFGEEKIPIVREEATFQVFRRGPTGRAIDVTVAFFALEEGVAIGGRPEGGYGGFSLRAAPAREQKITTYIDPSNAPEPRIAWLDYTALFDGKALSGITIIEGRTNPGWPNAFLTYPHLNCGMPAFPGDREYPLEKATEADAEPSLILKHRLWIHEGSANDSVLRDVVEAYHRFPEE
jgi:hypothetical protein